MDVLYNLTTLLSLIEISSIQQRYAEIVQQICKTVAAEQDVFTFIYASSNNVCNDTTDQFQLDIPSILHQTGMPNIINLLNNGSQLATEPYAKQFHHNLLSVVQLSESIHHNDQILQTLWQRLDRNRQSGLILLLPDDANEAYVRSIYAKSVENYAINVIALQPHLAVNEHSYWTLQLYPKQQTLRQNFPQHYQNIFPKQFENMHGHPFRILQNGWHPQLYNFTARDGTVRLSGYLGRALTKYAHLRNATIIAVKPSTKNIFNYTDSLNTYLSGEADTGPLWPVQISNPQLSYSCVYQHINFCLMVPEEKALPKFTFFRNIMHIWILILLSISYVCLSCIWTVLNRLERQRLPPFFDYIINIYVFQGLIGLPFWTNRSIKSIQKVIYIMISFSGVVIGTAYTTNLQSYNIEAPRAARIITVDDILERGVQVATTKANLPWVMNITDINRNIDKLTLFDNFTEFLIKRDSLDTHYAYSVTDMWTVYNEQQKYFSRPLFRLSDICFGNHLPMVLPMPANSVYRHDLNGVLGRLHEIGLKNYWWHHSFLELVEMNYTSLKDQNPKHGFQPFRVSDLRLVILQISVLYGISIGCFIFEVNWLRLRKLCNLLLRMYNY